MLSTWTIRAVVRHSCAFSWFPAFASNASIVELPAPWLEEQCLLTFQTFAAAAACRMVMHHVERGIVRTVRKMERQHAAQEELVRVGVSLTLERMGRPTLSAHSLQLRYERHASHMI